MTSKHPSFSARARFALTVAASFAGMLLVTGCGLGVVSTAGSGTMSAAAFGGKINGGPNPISGATVKLFTTGQSGGADGGYGVGQFVQEANQVGASGQDTAADGSFLFAGGYPCPTGQYLYVVSSGGDTGSGNNPKAFVVAALGRCDDLFSGSTYTGGFIYLNELSTVAAAYALGNFTTVTGTGLSAQVGIGAPSANNAAVGCVAGSPGCLTTAAAGLRHAFQNAANLVNPFSPTANVTLPGNPSATVPTQLIDTIANSLVACINSDGTNSACQTIFAATGTDISSGNTFQVAMNLAKNSSLAGSGYTPTQFMNASRPQTNFYQPYLNAAPTDYSIAINIPRLTGQTAGVQGLTYPYSGTLDINDNYYVGNYDSSAHTVSNAASFKSNATLVSFTPDNVATVAANGASVDSIGNLYLVGAAPVGTAGAVSRYTVDSSTGDISPTAATFTVGNSQLLSGAVDQHNNLWIGAKSGNLSEVATGQTSATYSMTIGGAVTAIAIDPEQNIWHTLSLEDVNHNAVAALSNTGTVASPSYVRTSYAKAYDFKGVSASGISFVAASPYDAYVTNLSTAPGIAQYTPLVTGAAVTRIQGAKYTSTGSTSPSNNQSDGNGVIWAADGPDVAKFVPGSTVIIGVKPCLAPISDTNTVCSATPYAGINSVSIDSTGSVWFLSSDTGTVNEMIGAAAPTWPFLPLGRLTKPQ